MHAETQRCVRSGGVELPGVSSSLVSVSIQEIFEPPPRGTALLIGFYSLLSLLKVLQPC